MSYQIGTLDIGVAFAGDVSGLQQASGAAGTAIDGFGNKATTSLKGVQAEAKRTDDSMARLANGIKSAFVVSSVAAGLIALKNNVMQATGAIIDAQVQLDKLNNGFKFGAGGAAGGARELAFVREEANRLGLELNGAANMYMKMVAAARGTTMEGAKTRETFTAIAEAATVMGMTGEQSERAMQAVVQMMSKGKVQAEELRGQLGEHLPGAFSIAARSMGVTEAELNKLLETGQVMSADFLPKFAAQLRNELGGSVEDATKSMQASLNRFETSWLTFKQNVAQSGAGSFLGSVITGASDEISAMSLAMENARASGAGFMGQMNQAAGMLIARTSINLVEEAAGGLNSTINALTGNALRLRENFDVMPLSMMGASEQAVVLEKRLAEALARQKELGEYKPGGNIYLNHEIYQAQQLVKELEAAKRARYNLDHPGTGASESRYSALVDAEALKKQQAQGAAYAELMTKLFTPQQKFTQAVIDTKKALGDLYTPEVERMLREQYIKPTRSAAEATDVFARALESVREKSSGLNANYTETIAAFNKGLKDGRFGAVGSEDAFEKYSSAVNALIQQQPFFVEAEKAKATSIAEAEKLLATARAGSLKLSEAAEEAQAASADQLAERLASMRDEIALIGLTAQQVAELTAAKAEQVIADKEIELIMLRNADASAAQISALEREINLRRQLVGAMRDKTVKEAAAESADQAQKEWKKASEQIEQSLTDALMRGFESGKGFAETLRDTVANMFKTLVLRPIVSAVVNPVAGAITAGLGLPGAASAATSGTSALSGLGTLGGSLGALGTGLGAGAGMIAGGGVGGWLTASTSLIGTGTAAGAMAGIGALAGPIGAALAVASLLKGLDDSGTMHTGGIGGYSAAGGTATGAAAGLRFGVDAKDYTASAAAASAQIAQSIVGMLDSTATTFGQKAGYYAATAFADDTSKDGAWGALMLKMGDQVLLDWANNPERDANVPRVFANGEAGAKEYAAAVAKDVRDYLITQTPAWADTMLTALGDAPSLEQLAATVGQINATATALDGMGRASQAFANLAESATNTLITALGGGEAAVANLGSYYTNYYSQADRAEIATRQLTEQLATLGVALPATRDAYRDLVDNAMASGNQQLAADLIKLSGAFASVSQSADDLARETIASQQEASRQAVETQRAAESAAKAIADQRLGLENQLLQLQGDTVELRRRELAALDPSNQALQQNIWLLQDQQTALEQQQEAERQALDAKRAIADQRLGLENQLLQLQGDTVELRRRELAAIDPSNQALQQHIWLLQDQQAALQSFTSAFDGVASAFSGLASAESSLADIDLQARIDAANAANEAAKAMGDAAQNLRDYVRGQTTTPQEQFADVLRRAMQGDAAAMQALPGAATAANDAALAAASSATEYAIARAKTLVAVDQAASLAASKSGLIDVPQKEADSPTVAALRAIETAVKAMSNAVTSAISIDLVNNLGKIDLNKNSAIEFDELKSAFGGMASEATLAKVFATLDVDGNGQITLLEAISRNTDGTKLAISGLGSVIQQLQAGGLSSAAAAQQIADLTKISGTTASGRPAGSDTASGINTDSGTKDVWISSGGAVAVGDTIYTKNGGRITVAEAINFVVKNQTDPEKVYEMAVANGISSASLDAMMGWQPGSAMEWAKKLNLPAFAAGGVFTNGIVTRPTAFDIGLMGEAGEEAIMPLSRMPNGQLGVAAYSGGRDTNAAVVAELRELRTELQNLRAETRATAINTGRIEQLTKRVTRNGEAMQTQAVPA